MSFRLVIPCYNEAPNLPALVERAASCAHRRGFGPDEFRLVLVENGSRDDSRAVLAGLKAGPHGAYVDVVPIAANRGYGDGILQGLRAAAPGGDVLGWTHADLQCDPDDAFRALDELRRADGPTLVKGRRHGRAPGERVVSLGLEVLATAILGRRLHEINAQPKVFPASLLDRLTDPPADFPFDLYVLVEARKAGYKIREIDVEFPPRRHGRSNWSATARSRVRTILRFVRYLVRYRVGG